MEPLLSIRPRLYVPHVVLDHTSGVPMHRQVYRDIAQAIRDGAVFHDARLPSTRVMANLLGVSRNTVLKAYDDLAADGLIEGKHGSGTRVRQHSVPPAPSWFGLRQVIQSRAFRHGFLRSKTAMGIPCTFVFDPRPGIPTGPGKTQRSRLVTKGLVMASPESTWRYNGRTTNVISSKRGGDSAKSILPSFLGPGQEITGPLREDSR